MSEYPIGIKGEMVHCLDDSEYARDCYARLEREVLEEDLKDTEEEDLPSKSLKSYIIESNTSLDKISLKGFDVKIVGTKDNTLKVLRIFLYSSSLHL